MLRQQTMGAYHPGSVRAAAHLAPFVEPAIRTRFEGASADHGRLWRPWLADISEETRAAMDALVAAGCAPSPFCRTESGSGPGGRAGAASGALT